MMNDNQCVYVMYAWIWTDMDCTAVPIFWCCFVWYCHPWFHPYWRLVWRDCPACITLQFAAGGWGMFSCVQRALTSSSGVSWGRPTRRFNRSLWFFFQSHRISKFESTFIIFHPQTPHYLLRFWGEIFLLVLNHLSYALGWKIYDPHHQHPSTLRCRLDLQTLEVKTVWGTCFHLVFVDRCSVVFYLVLHYKLGLIWRDLFLKVLKGRWGS